MLAKMAPGVSVGFGCVRSACVALGWRSLVEELDDAVAPMGLGFGLAGDPLRSTATSAISMITTIAAETFTRRPGPDHGLVLNPNSQPVRRGADQTPHEGTDAA